MLYITIRSALILKPLWWKWLLLLLLRHSTICIYFIIEIVHKVQKINQTVTVTHITVLNTNEQGRSLTVLCKCTRIISFKSSDVNVVTDRMSKLSLITLLIPSKRLHTNSCCRRLTNIFILLLAELLYKILSIVHGNNMHKIKHFGQKLNNCGACTTPWLAINWKTRCS